jgi:hypothetical protein
MQNRQRMQNCDNSETKEDTFPLPKPPLLPYRPTGQTLTQHDPIALAQAIEQLLTDSSLRVRLAIEARALIEQNFEIHQNTAQLRTMFQSTQSASFHLASEKLSYQEVN